MHSAAIGTPSSGSTSASGVWPYPPRVVTEDALAARGRSMAVFDQVPASVLDQLREAGSLEHTQPVRLSSRSWKHF